MKENIGIQVDARRVLFTDTDRSAHGVRMAIAFLQHGCKVAMLCPERDHPVHSVPSIRTVYYYNGFRPLHGLRSAIRDFRPDLIVPTDDLGAAHLCRLHALASAENDGVVTESIERSLCSPANLSIALDRLKFLELAREEGIRIPETRAVLAGNDLSWDNFSQEGKWAFKVDGSWGGDGVWEVQNLAEARIAVSRARRMNPMLWALKRRNHGRGWGFILDEFRHSTTGLIAQAWIDGRPANCAVASWQGRILAGTAAEVLISNGQRGPSAVIEIVEGIAMLEAAKRVAARLHLSGFFGLDFVIDHGTGLPYLIEMNPRCTPLAALPLGAGRDLPAALSAQLSGAPIPETQPLTQLNRIALYPKPAGESTLAQVPESSYYYDVPHGYPQLAEILAKPRRSRIGRLASFIKSTTGKNQAHRITAWQRKGSA